MREIVNKLAELLCAARGWAAQGPRSRWSTAPSLRLYDAVTALGTWPRDPHDIGPAVRSLSTSEYDALCRMLDDAWNGGLLQYDETWDDTAIDRALARGAELNGTNPQPPNSKAGKT